MAQYSTQHAATIAIFTSTYTYTPATDRDLESGLSKSHTRKNPRNMPEKGKVRRISGEVSMRYRRANRSSTVKWRKDQSEISPIFEEEANHWTNRERIVLDPLLKLEICKIQWLLPFKPLEQVIITQSAIHV